MKRQDKRAQRKGLKNAEERRRKRRYRKEFDSQSRSGAFNREKERRRISGQYILPEAPEEDPNRQIIMTTDQFVIKKHEMETSR